MCSRSASDSNGRWKLYVRPRYLHASPLQAWQQAFPPLCSPLSNCCSGLSLWKNHATSCTFTPLLVSAWCGRRSRHSCLVSTYASCSIYLIRIKRCGLNDGWHIFMPSGLHFLGCEEGWIIQALDKVHNVSMVHYCGIVCPDHEASQSHISWEVLSFA